LLLLNLSNSATTFYLHILNLNLMFVIDIYMSGVNTVFAGNRMFSFQFADVDVYLPQLLNMYIYVHDVAEALHPYLIYRLIFLTWLFFNFRSVL